MMRFLLVSLLAFALAACSSSPEKTQAILAASQVEPFQSYAVATLAPVGSFEWKAAPVYTKLAVLIHQAEVKLRRDEITVDEAVEVHRVATEIRARLNDAVKADADGKRDAATKSLLTAGVQVLALESALENSQVTK